MSGWDAYITTTMGVCPNKLLAAAIYGCENHVVSKWAESQNCPLTDEEAKVFDLSEDEMRGKGVKIGGRKYILLRCEPGENNTILIQLKSAKDECGKTLNATVYRTQKVFILAVGTPEALGAEVSKACFHTGDYLSKCGY